MNGRFKAFLKGCSETMCQIHTYYCTMNVLCWITFQIERIGTNGGGGTRAFSSFLKRRSHLGLATDPNHSSY